MRRRAIWEIPGLPRTGWRLVDVLDTGPDSTARCDTCKTSLRYVHVLRHSESLDPIHVGVRCAAHLTGDRHGPRTIEKALKRWQARRSTWLKQTNAAWRNSLSGRFELKLAKRKVTVLLRGGLYCYAVSNGRGPTPISRERFLTAEEASAHSFEILIPKPTVTQQHMPSQRDTCETAASDSREDESLT